MPGLNGAIVPLVVRVPSGNTSRLAPSSARSPQCARLAATGPVRWNGNAPSKTVAIRRAPPVREEVVGSGGHGRPTTAGARQDSQHRQAVQVAGVVRDQQRRARQRFQLLLPLDNQRSGDQVQRREQHCILEQRPNSRNRAGARPGWQRLREASRSRPLQGCQQIGYRPKLGHLLV